MTDTLKPRDDKDVEAAIAWALAQGKTLEVIGRGTKRVIGRAAQTDLTLDLSGLSGVTLYEPEELVLSAKAGTPLAEIDALLAAHGQELAFEPVDYGPILGQPAGGATLGGALAANLSGPRRIKAGAGRDHFLGVKAVSGRGEAFKSGGRVVKNVTGYDLCKLLAGSWGTLAAMTDVTVKVLPRAEAEETLLVVGLDDRTAVRAMAAAMGSGADVSGAAHLPAAAAGRLDADGLPAHQAVTALRLEGVPPSISQRRTLLERLMTPIGRLGRLPDVQSKHLWRAVRDAVPFAARGDRPLWRISTAPSAGPDVAARLTAQDGAEVLYDWAGGLVWAELPSADDAGAEQVRRAFASTGGHATLVRAPASVRASVAVFEPLEPTLAALTRRVKDGFDPQGVLNPGRMYAGV